MAQQFLTTFIAQILTQGSAIEADLSRVYGPYRIFDHSN